MTNRKSSGVGAAVLVTVATVGAAAGAAMLARKRKGEIKEFVVANVLENRRAAPASPTWGRGWSAAAPS